MAELFDIVVRRQIYTEGLKAAKAAEFAAVLSKLRTELAHRLAGFQYADLGDATKTALRTLIVDLRKIARTIFDPYLKSLIGWLQRFVRVDADMLAGLYGDVAPEHAQAVQEAADPEGLWAMAISVPLAATGTLALPFLAALLPSMYVKFERLTFQHYASRSTKAELLAAIVGPGTIPNLRRPGVPGSTPRAKTPGKRPTSPASAAGAKPGNPGPQGLMRQLNAQGAAATNTIIQHLANQVNEALAHKIVGYYEWVSVLDDRTTKICTERDGRRYAFGRGPIPPAHVNCRSTIVPVRPGSPPTPSGFGDWLRGQPDEFVNDALDGRRSASYQGTSPLSLNEYGGKSPLIGL